MSTLTDYQVLSDGSFDIDGSPGGPPDQQQLTFTLPANFTVGTNRGKPILSFIVNVVSDDASVGVWVNPNFPLTQSTREISLSWSNMHHADTGLWEAISGTQFRAGEENRIVFGMLPADSGRVRFRDVVLWYQRNE